jgi:AAA+ superfamily predicted ATPase
MVTKLMSELDTLIRARYPLLYLETYEETRAIKCLEEISQSLGKEFKVWTYTNGLRAVGAKEQDTETQDPMAVLELIESSKGEAVCVLLDMHSFLNNDREGGDMIRRKMRDLYDSLKASSKTIVLVSPQAKIPMELQKSITVLDMPLPGYEDHRKTLRRSIHMLDDALRHNPDLQQSITNMAAQVTSLEDRLVQAGLGLTTDEYENVLAKCYAQGSVEIGTILSEKKQIIRKAGVVEYYEAKETVGDIGGLDNLKDYLRKSKKRYSKEAEEYGLEKPRGIIAVGPPGTGKSLSAKATAAELQVPLLKLNAADLFSKWYGETTGKVSQALKLAEAVAPCVLWIDEIEKVFGHMEHEESRRAGSVLLTHFEECEAPIFRFATCNRPFDLPPELMQRFDRTFHVDLPNRRERMEIFTIHLRKFKQNPETLNVDVLAERTEGFVGREIRIVIKEAMSNAFDKGMPTGSVHILEEIARTTPISVQKKDEISQSREWGKKYALPASIPDESGPGTRKVEFNI